MIRHIKRHYDRLQLWHKGLLGLFVILWTMTGLFSSIFATLLPFEDDLTTLFAGMWFSTGNHSEVHFNQWGNNFAGMIFWLTGETLSIPQNITVNGSQEIECSRHLQGLYYNNERGRRLWPMDTWSLAILSWQWSGYGYNTMTLTGGFYTNCTWIAGYYPANNEIFWYIEHVRSGITMQMVAGVNYDFLNNGMEAWSAFSNTLISTWWAYSGWIWDNYGWIAQISSGQSQRCGNGLMEPSIWEQCDDGNSTSLDGCNASCARETPTCNLTFTGDANTLSWTFTVGWLSGREIFDYIDYGSWWLTWTALSHIYASSGYYTGTAYIHNSWANSVTGSCRVSLQVTEAPVGLCVWFGVTSASVTSGDNFTLTCSWSNVTWYILQIRSWLTNVLSSTSYTTADHYTRTTGSSLPAGSYSGTCVVLTGNGVGPQCSPNLNLYITDPVVPNTCNNNFEGNVIPLNAVLASGVSYFSNTTGIMLGISATNPVAYTITGGFTGTPLTGSYTWAQFSHVITRPIYLTGVNTRNNIYSIFTTWTCEYTEALRRIYVDTINPTQPVITSPSTWASVCSSWSTRFSWTAATDTGAWISGYRYSIRHASGTIYANGVDSGITGVTLLTQNMLLGDYTRTVQVVDLVGNTSISATGTFSISPNSCSTWVYGTGIQIIGSLSSILNADLDTVYGSEIFYVRWLSWSALISINNWTLIINGTGIGTTGMITSHDELKIELVSSDQYDEMVSSTVSVAGLTWVFNVTTKNWACDLTRTQQLAITRVYGLLKDQYDGNTSLLNDFLATFQGILGDETDISEDCSLGYLLQLINDDLDGFAIDTSNHIAPNCKEYQISYNDSERAYYSPMMKNRYYFINRETLIRHIDFYNAGDCHINTYGNVSWSDNRNTANIHVAPNGKIYHITSAGAGYTSVDLVWSKYFDSFMTMTNYVDSRNPATDVWIHDVDRTFTPITYLAPNSKEYRIYKTDRWYMSYKLMKVRYFNALTELENYINKNNPVKK